jgi:hypothetical protein
MSHAITVTMGGEDYEIAALNMKASRTWRENFAQPLEKLIAAMRLSTEVELNDMAGVAQILALFQDTLLHSVDLAVDALFAYAPHLPRETIEDNATDAEAMVAFVEVLKLAYPFGAIWTLARRGLSQPATKKK